jgi:hypothetical protein
VSYKKMILNQYYRCEIRLYRFIDFFKILIIILESVHQTLMFP